MLRLGLVDFDTSHAVEFTRRFNHSGVAHDQYVDGARVVLGCPGISSMAPERIELHRPLIAKCGVAFVQSPAEMLGHVDGVLITSLCGAAHLEHARLFLQNNVPVFVDKPLATTWADAREMATLAEQHGTLLWHASALRFTDDLTELRRHASSLGPIHGAASFGPGWHGTGNPGLLHYGIHAVEQLFALFGPGCSTVSNQSTPSADVVTGRWMDGRIGTVRCSRAGHTAYGVTLFAEQGVVTNLISTRSAYRNLCEAIRDAFLTGSAPVPIAESLQVIQFLLAANASALSEGVPVALASLRDSNLTVETTRRTSS